MVRIARWPHGTRTPIARSWRPTAAALSRPGSGLLAADESTGHVSGKRLRRLDWRNSEEQPPRLIAPLLAAPAPLGLGEMDKWRIPTRNPVSSRRASLQPRRRLDPRCFNSKGLIAGIQAESGLSPWPVAARRSWCTGLKVLRERAAKRLARSRPVCQCGPCCASFIPMLPVGAVRA